jgi:flagellin-like hook-associated protein FlgL
VVTGLNNSGAAEDLGLTNLTFDAGSARYIGRDRANLRVDNLFSDLIDLRQALLANDSTGITLAGERLTASADRLSAAQALVGTYSARVKQADEDLADRIVLDEKMRSELQEVDFAAAATRFSQLQTQLEAGLRTANALGSRSLFDFLG